MEMNKAMEFTIFRFLDKARLSMISEDRCKEMTQKLPATQACLAPLKSGRGRVGVITGHYGMGTDTKYTQMRVKSSEQNDQTAEYRRDEARD